ncbi:MAG: ribosome maturation factor RimM [Chroococcus sp. CMT-3BRIN-NPC107]|jgi:16S rRNA processing protein RimM|nr:ribosome maturation factor RimM [Chroococcus sp. CMT-3BRIN-NPC107]
MSKKNIDATKTPNLKLPNVKAKTSYLKLPNGWLQIGKIVAAQGLQGELRVYPDSDFPERFVVPGTRWLLRVQEDEPQAVELLHGRYIEGKGLYAIALSQITTRTQAEELRGCLLLVRESDRPTLGEDEYHVLDLIGLEVFNQLTQSVVGKVVDVIAAGNDLLEVKPISTDTPAKNILIPFVKAIAPVVDLENGRIEIVPPPGLLELD